MKLAGHATPEGTAAYSRRITDATPTHFRQTFDGLTVSSIGLGTGGFEYQSAEDIYTQYIETVQFAVSTGVNVIDTATSYGGGVSELIVGRAIADLIEKNELMREETVIASKAGYLPYSAMYFHEQFTKKGLCNETDLVNGNHCLAPAFIRDQIHQSRRNLELDTIDIYFLHNPEEQLQRRGPEVFSRQVQLAFEVLEEAVSEGWIRCYGFATAEGFRSSGSAFHPLNNVVNWARDVAGDAHHFRFAQLPINLEMSEAIFLDNHLIDDTPVSFIQTAKMMNISVMASVSILRAHFPWPIPSVLRDACPALATDAQLALQFTRSVPYVSVALVGMSRTEHVRENLQLRSIDPVDLMAPLEPG